MMKNPKHPGVVLRGVYLDALDMNANQLAIRLVVPRTRITRLLAGDTSLSADTALRLAKFFKTTPQYWMNMQTNFDLSNTTVDISEVRAYA